MKTRVFCLCIAFISMLSLFALGEEQRDFSSFDSLISEFSEEIKESKEKSLVMNFDGKGLSSLGTYSLYKSNFTNDSKLYRVYKFSDTDPSAIDRIIEDNLARNYAKEEIDQGDYQLIMLKQYGEDGLSVILSKNAGDYTLVFIEKGMEIDGFVFYKTCPDCEGNGKRKCSNCHDSRKCSTCEGTGKARCYMCKDNKGVCYLCNGVGYRISPSTGHMLTCVSCNGFGSCATCHGTGHKEYGGCPLCSNTGKCPYCKGDLGKCSKCNGSGKIAE